MKRMSAREGAGQRFGQRILANDAILPIHCFAIYSIIAGIEPRFSVSFGDAVLLVVSLPMTSLAVSAAIYHENTPSAGR